MTVTWPGANSSGKGRWSRSWKIRERAKRSSRRQRMPSMVLALEEGSSSAPSVRMASSALKRSWRPHRWPSPLRPRTRSKALPRKAFIFSLIMGSKERTSVSVRLEKRIRTWSCGMIRTRGR
ncbi:hypothetical protein D3C86_1444140 [compost metagenome]